MSYQIAKKTYKIDLNDKNIISLTMICCTVQSRRFRKGDRHVTVARVSASLALGRGVGCIRPYMVTGSGGGHCCWRRSDSDLGNAGSCPTSTTRAARFAL